YEPIAVFFSSYQYAQNIEAYLSKLHPEYKVSIQPRKVDLKEQKLFLENGLNSADALFLILGSSYSEGVDQLGGRITKAIVVGPALPEVNCVQEARLDALSCYHREVRFQRVFIEPAMRRIHQALGRLVRAPEHKAKILLHGRRFAEYAYYDQLADEYKTDQRITNQVDLINWLRKKTIF
ncbi:MAG: helicase C-terminal domain-containing protein, partial [Verrucomicrobiota bacterium]|nr:helicase C-terminal domain-containing protein [Verrucomicrobiota bacterium]